MLQCSGIYFKCKMRERLLQLRRERRHGRLGRLGPCTFQPIGTFLRTALEDGGATPFDMSGQKRLVACGDVHGDLLVLLSVLFMAGLIDESANWIGGSAVFVQCGDFIDREGRGSSTVDTSRNQREEVDIVQYMYHLNRQARPGRVVSLLGNHEAMLSFRLKGYERFARTAQDKGWGLRREELFRPGAPMGLYLSRFCPVAVRVGDFICVHGDVPEDPEGATQRMREALAGLRSPSGPELQSLFSRRLSVPAPTARNSDTCEAALRKDFARIGLPWKTGGIVVSHTVQDGGIPEFCKGKVWRLDLGMSEAFGPGDTIGALRVRFGWEGKEQTLAQTIVVEGGPVLRRKECVYVNGKKKGCEVVRAAGSASLRWRMEEQDEPAGRKKN